MLAGRQDLADDLNRRDLAALGANPIVSPRMIVGLGHGTIVVFLLRADADQGELKASERDDVFTADAPIINHSPQSATDPEQDEIPFLYVVVGDTVSRTRPTRWTAWHDHDDTALGAPVVIELHQLLGQLSVRRCLRHPPKPINRTR